MNKEQNGNRIPRHMLVLHWAWLLIGGFLFMYNYTYFQTQSDKLLNSIIMAFYLLVPILINRYYMTKKEYIDDLKSILVFTISVVLMVVYWNFGLMEKLIIDFANEQGTNIGHISSLNEVFSNIQNDKEFNDKQKNFIFLSLLTTFVIWILNLVLLSYFKKLIEKRNSPK